MDAEIRSVPENGSAPADRTRLRRCMMQAHDANARPIRPALTPAAIPATVTMLIRDLLGPPDPIGLPATNWVTVTVVMDGNIVLDGLGMNESWAEDVCKSGSETDDWVGTGV